MHSWLYEFPAYRAAIGRFLATVFGGPLDPDEAARVAAAIDTPRQMDPGRELDGQVQRKKRAAIPKQITRNPISTAKQSQSGENGVPPTIT